MFIRKISKISLIVLPIFLAAFSVLIFSFLTFPINISAECASVEVLDETGTIEFLYECLPPNIPENTPPVLTLLGDNPIQLILGDIFTDPGANALDKEDGNITHLIEVTGVVDTTTVGIYELNYSIIDSGGLSDVATRQVIVSDNPEPPPSDFNINIIATKIVCDDEINLPNWGEGGPSITETTAADFLSENSEKCRLASDWYFQWGENDVSDPGADFVGEAEDGWNTFGPTDSNGEAAITLIASPETSYFWMREVLKDSHLAFSYPGDNNSQSAEMYCHTDVLNYDNYDRIDAPFTDGETYYCVAFNVASSTPPGPVYPSLTLIADPVSIILGATSTLTWDSKNALICEAPWTTSTSTSGSKEVSPSATTDYSMTCSNNDGSIAATTTVTVSSEPPQPTPSVTLSAEPSTITVGDSSILSWSSQDVLSCSASWTAASSTSGSASVSPDSTTEYGITCVGDYGNALASTTITVNPKIEPPVNPPSDNGGGGISGRRHDISYLLAPEGEVLGAQNCVYLFDHLKIGWANDPIEVLKLKSFLNIFEGENLYLDGIFDQATFEAVKRFQIKYADDILNPWGYEDNEPTGFVYILTKKKINEIFCTSLFPVTSTEQTEIDNFRNSGSVDSIYDEISITDDDLGVDLDQSEIQNTIIIVSDKTDVSEGAPVIELAATTSKDGGSIIRNAAISLFGLPQKIANNWKYVLITVVFLAIVVTVVNMSRDSKNDDDSTEAALDLENNNKIIKEVVPENEESPIIVLPGSGKGESFKKENKEEDTLPLDEEIIIEDEDSEEIIEGPEESNKKTS